MKLLWSKLWMLICRHHGVYPSPVCFSCTTGVFFVPTLIKHCKRMVCITVLPPLDSTNLYIILWDCIMQAQTQYGPLLYKGRNASIINIKIQDRLFLSITLLICFFMHLACCWLAAPVWPLSNLFLSSAVKFENFHSLVTHQRSTN